MSKLVVIIVIVVAILIGVFCINYYHSIDFVTATIDNKENVVHGSGDGVESKYLIFTDKEVLQNIDSLLFLKFNSSDFYNQIKIGKTYRFKVVGWRIPFFSMYRNVIKIELVS